MVKFSIFQNFHNLVLSLTAGEYLLRVFSVFFVCFDFHFGFPDTQL